MLVLRVFYLVGWIFNNPYEPSGGCWVTASPGSVTVRQQSVTGTSGCPQSSGHGWGISEGQQRLGLPCGNLNCQGGHTGISSIPIFTFPSHAHISQPWPRWCFHPLPSPALGRVG